MLKRTMIASAVTVSLMALAACGLRWPQEPVEPAPCTTPEWTRPPHEHGGVWQALKLLLGNLHIIGCANHHHNRHA